MKLNDWNLNSCMNLRRRMLRFHNNSRERCSKFHEIYLHLSSRLMHVYVMSNDALTFFFYNAKCSLNKRRNNDASGKKKRRKFAETGTKVNDTERCCLDAKQHENITTLRYINKRYDKLTCERFIFHVFILV